VQTPGAAGIAVACKKYPSAAGIEVQKLKDHLYVLTGGGGNVAST
jgi:hypothetical protein